ncbi:MAG: hypothetical protein HKN04_04765 [Rhodothermaceae bacterium]|nr:hypothetical protein [Rhodothermaceae bacterium]
MTARACLLLLVVLIGTRPAWAQAATDQAAEQLEPLLAEMALLAATAALIHDAQGRYPATPFELLSAPVAADTELRGITFADLGLSADADTLRIVYLLTPTPETPTERGGAVLVTRIDDGYTARFRLAHRDDADFSTRSLPITQADLLRVRETRGMLCLDLAHIRALLADGTLAQRAPYLSEDEDGLTVEFTAHGGTRSVGTATLTPDP